MKFRLCITGDLGFEFWQDIPGYEGLYQASTYGRTKSVSRKIFRNRGNGYFAEVPEKIMKHCIMNKYEFVVLAKNGTKTNTKVSRIIAKTFIPNPYNLPEVNHKDENKLNDSVENLEWCDAKYNSNYGTRTERIKNKISKPVVLMDCDGNTLKTFKSITEASKETGCCMADISCCCNGIFKQTSGKYFKFKDAAI